MILSWDFYRSASGASGLGTVQDYFNSESQSIYLDSTGDLDTRTAFIEDGDWEHATQSAEISVLQEGWTGSEWTAPNDELLFGVTNDAASVTLLRYRFAVDVTELVASGSEKLRADSQIVQASLTLKNPGEDVILADSSLFEPGAKLTLSLSMGDSVPYPMGVFFLDDVNFDAHSPTLSMSGRNTIGYRLAQQTFDNDTTFTGTGKEAVEWIFGLAGVTNYVVGASDVSQTWTFEPNDTLLKGLEKIFEFFAPWEMVELPDGRIIVGYPWFIADYQQNSVYQFAGGTDVMRRKTKKAADAAYSKVRVTGKDANGDELTPVLLSVQSFSNWSLGSHKTKHVKAADGMTQLELQAYAEQLAAELALIGVGESFTGPPRPWLLVGDVASISWDGETSEDLGLVTSITHRFGDSGFFTDFAVDSGGVAEITRSTGAITRSAGVNGYNRAQDLADLIGVIGAGKDGRDGKKGDDGDPGTAAGFGTVSASVDNNTGTPSVQVTTSGPDTAKNFAFAFHNLKGQPGQDGQDGQDGAPGAAAEITGATAAATQLPAGSSPTAAVTAGGTAQARSFAFSFGIPKGDKGDTGDTVYNVIISDTVTSAKYALVIESGRIEAVEVAASTAATDPVLVDLVSGKSYTLAAESGRLILVEV